MSRKSTRKPTPMVIRVQRTGAASVIVRKDFGGTNERVREAMAGMTQEFFSAQRWRRLMTKSRAKLATSMTQATAVACGYW